MIYTPMTKTALKLCFEAHRDQTDKSGMPYVFHPFHLAEQMSDEKTTVVALLYDVIEDTDYSTARSKTTARIFGVSEYQNKTRRLPLSGFSVWAADRNI